MRLASRLSRLARYARSIAPANATPPSAATMSEACSASSSPANAASSPRGQGAKKCSMSERLQYDEQHRTQEHRQGRNLVDPAVEHVTVAIAIMLEIEHQFAQPDVVCDENGHQQQLGVQPPAGDAISLPQPHAEDDGEQRARR